MNPRVMTIVLVVTATIGIASIGFNVFQGVQNHQVRKQLDTWAQLYEGKEKEVDALTSANASLQAEATKVRASNAELRQANQIMEMGLRQRNAEHQQMANSLAAYTSQAQEQSSGGPNWLGIAAGLLPLLLP